MHNPFENQLERLARTLTEQFGVQVQCGGDQACTDGRKILLPSVPEPMDSDLERMMVGFLDHEMAHVAFSNFKVVAGFSKRHPGGKGLLNAVEDAFVERAAIQRWPGVRANLDKMFAGIRGRVAALIARRDAFDRFITAVYLKLSHHNDMMGLAAELSGYEDVLDRFAGVSRTRDSARLAEELLVRWRRQHPPEAAPQQAPADGSAAEAPSQDEDESEGLRPAQGKPETGTPDVSADDSAANSPCAGEPAPQGEADQNSATEGDPPSPVSGTAIVGQGGGTLVTQALAEAIADRIADVDGSAEYRVYTRRYDRIEPIAAASDAEVRQLLSTGVDTVRRLRRGLANALRSAEKRWWREDQTRGALSPRTLYRLCTDRSRLDVFRRRSMVQGRSTAVCAVLDASGSMTEKKMKVARTAMRVLIEALADLGIPTHAFTFTTGDSYSMSRAERESGVASGDLHDRFSRVSNLEIGVIKEFGESAKIALRRLPSIHGGGLTPLGEAMAIGGSRLLPRPETRKIMLVLTDGRPGCEGVGPAARSHALHVAGLVRACGMDLIGIGIQDESLCGLIADTIVIRRIEELPAQLCKLMGRTLRKGVRNVG